jgi:hypothetical protein
VVSDAALPLILISSFALAVEEFQIIQSQALVIYPTVEELIVKSIGRTAPEFICLVPISIASLLIHILAN